MVAPAPRAPAMDEAGDVDASNVPEPAVEADDPELGRRGSPVARPLLILGTGGGVHDILDVVEAINATNGRPVWEVLGFLDDGQPAAAVYLGLPVHGRLADAPTFEGWSFINAIGSDRSYRRRPHLLAGTGLAPDRFATLVNPAASVSRRASLGRGVLVNFGVSIGGGVVVGDHVTLGPGCIVGHDAVVGEAAMVAPGAVISGGVRVNEGAYIGAGSVVRQHLEIGAGALVGMGAVVTRDVPAGEVVVGNPARRLTRAGVAVEA